MKPHTKNYLEHHGLSVADVVLCEVCYRLAVDIHHIDHKGMGGAKDKDGHENLIALCRECHLDAHKGKLTKEILRGHKR